MNRREGIVTVHREEIGLGKDGKVNRGMAVEGIEREGEIRGKGKKEGIQSGRRRRERRERVVNGRV